MDTEIKLSPEQEYLLKVMEETKENLFITGKAGAGKSVLLTHFRENTAKNVMIAAPTGIAALNVRGQTIHSLFRIAPQLHRPGTLESNERVCTLLKRIDALVIDEISMTRADLIDAIDERLREAFENNIAFGGVQIIMFGDVFQLPPVVDESLVQYFEAVHGGSFFFNALVWKKATFKIYELTQVFRQKDPIFKSVLNAVRDGSFNDEQITQLNIRYGVPTPTEGTITLAPTNNLVTRINQKRLDQLEGKARQYRAIVTGQMKKGVFPTEEVLQLKKGAQVVFLKNDKDKRWINGTVGIVEELYDDRMDVKVDGSIYPLEQETWEEITYTYDPEKEEVEEEVTSSFTQFPIRLAWALTIHKSQGQTYESVCLDLTTGTFAPGQMYVALSRATSLEGLYLVRPVKREHIIVDQKVKLFMARCEKFTLEEPEPTTVINHDEIVNTLLIASDAKMEVIQNGVVFHHDENEGDIILEVKEGIATPVQESATNAKREKKGRTKKERKSTQGRKPDGKVAKEPMQLSLDVRTIDVLTKMGVNKSKLFQDLLGQYEPFLAKWAEMYHDEIE